MVSSALRRAVPSQPEIRGTASTVEQRQSTDRCTVLGVVRSTTRSPALTRNSRHCVYCRAETVYRSLCVICCRPLYNAQFCVNPKFATLNVLQNRRRRRRSLRTRADTSGSLGSTSGFRFKLCTLWNGIICLFLRVRNSLKQCFGDPSQSVNLSVSLPDPIR